jgi:superfamily II DNA/RNA helicase
MSFENLGLDPKILQALETSGYTEPTPVQTATIPLVLAGHDLMVSAQTGSGKTAAFMLPALHKLATPSAVAGRGPRILVLTPTRELALQITTASEKYGRNLPRIKMGTILGGMPYPLQNKMLSSPLDILVATPGRLLDHIGRGRIDFTRLEILVIDEADRMLDMGFIDDVAEIGRSLPKTRQTLLLSATFEGAITKLAETILREPRRVAIAGAQTKHENIEQRLLYTDDMGHKNRLLDHLLRTTEVKQALVFTSTKANADDLADRLAIEGFEAAALHGDMNQRERTRTLTGMRQGRIRVLVATDVAARGLDVQGITHVFNYDLPRQAEDYVHRIGRTGRAGRSGIAISFAGGRDTGQVKQIERYTAQPIPVHTVAGLEPRYPASSQRKPGPRSSNPRGNGSNSSRSDTRPPARREHGANGNTTRTDSRQPWGKKQEWSNQPPSQRRVEADPYDRQGDRFRAELRTQAERSPFAGNGNRKSGPKPFNREQPYAQVDDHRGNGAAPAIRRVPQVTVLAKKTREE